MARASSGSRSSSNSIEPLMSANRAVTVLRSPSSDSDGASDVIFSESTSESDSERAANDNASDVPHSPQKSSPGSFAAPHFGQELASAPPHLEQNLRRSRLSAPHFAHFTLNPRAAPWRLSGPAIRSLR